MEEGSNLELFLAQKSSVSKKDHHFTEIVFWVFYTNFNHLQGDTNKMLFMYSNCDPLLKTNTHFEFKKSLGDMNRKSFHRGPNAFWIIAEELWESLAPSIKIVVLLLPETLCRRQYFTKAKILYWDSWISVDSMFWFVLELFLRWLLFMAPVDVTDAAWQWGRWSSGWGYSLGSQLRKNKTVRKGSARPSLSGGRREEISNNLREYGERVAALVGVRVGYETVPRKYQSSSTSTTGEGIMEVSTRELGN